MMEGLFGVRSVCHPFGHLLAKYPDNKVNMRIESENNNPKPVGQHKEHNTAQDKIQFSWPRNQAVLYISNLPNKVDMQQTMKWQQQTIKHKKKNKHIKTNN